MFTERGSCVITGRSDATLNRGGVRLGTSEFYSALEELDEVVDSLVVHLEEADELILFVVLRDGLELDDAMRKRIAGALRDALSPRHVPDTIVALPVIPQTLTGKKLELPVKRILTGVPAAEVVSPDALVEPRVDGARRRLREHAAEDPLDAASPAGPPARAHGRPRGDEGVLLRRARLRARRAAAARVPGLLALPRRRAVRPRRRAGRVRGACGDARPPGAGARSITSRSPPPATRSSRRASRDAGVEAVANDVPAAGLRQLFVTDPNGVRIELNVR